MSQNRTVNYAMVGCGMMGREHLRNIALLPYTNIAAIFEPDREMANLSRELAPNAVFTDTLAELLEIEKLDCIVITSPNYCHVEQLIDIGKRRHLPILVEKPIFTDPADDRRLLQFRKQYTAPIWVAMEYRYMPPIAAFIEQVNAATGGVKMLTIREHRFPFLTKVNDWNRFNRYSGGTFVEKCCHFFDLMRFTLKAEPVRVMASGGQDVNHLDEQYNGETPDILDNGFVIVDFNNGARAMLELCMFSEGSRYQEVVSAVGAKGKLEAFVPGPGRFWNHDIGPAPIPKIVNSPRLPTGPIETDMPVDATILAAGDHNGSTFYQHQRFQNLVLGNLEVPDVDFADGVIAVRMGIAAQRSIEERRAVEMREMG